ncbi:MAG TPA: hypothetical protein VLF89_08810, partial [Candidatus Saccharimonadales bacterium]|nr:hypothetical protein [Candidatus Saccharimonadales bacterium]
MQKNELIEEEFSFKEYFIPLTNAKAITWIIVIGLIVYFISLFNGFVWDDLPQYLNNPITHSILNTPQIIANRLSTFYRPFPTILFSAIYILFGPTAFWYHLFQVVLFLITTVLFYLLLKKFVSRSLAFLLSIIFLIHPMNVESVAYISSSQTVLSLLFGLLALFVLENEKLRDVYKYSMVFLFLLFSILSKENGWIFFILIPLFMYFNKSKRFIRKDYLFFTVSCLLIICIYSSFILIFPGLNGTITEPIPILHAPLSIRLLTLPKIIFYYIYTFVFPLQLGVTQQWLVTQVDFQNFVFPLLVDSIFFISILLSGNYI